MENLLLQTKEYVKELMVNYFKSAIPSLEKVDNFPFLANNFMDNKKLLWLWLLPDGRAIYFSDNRNFGVLVKCPDKIEAISPDFAAEHSPSCKIYDAIYYRKVYDKKKDDGKSYNTCPGEGLVVEFLYENYDELLALQYVEAMDCEKKGRYADQQTTFSNRMLWKNHENRPFQLRIDGFLLSEDYEKIVDFNKMHKTTLTPDVEEYEKNPWSKKLFDTFKTTFFPLEYSFSQIDLADPFHFDFNRRKGFIYRNMLNVFLEKGNSLRVIDNSKKSCFEHQSWSDNGENAPKVIYCFPAVKNLETLFERQKEFFAKEKSAQEIREFYESLVCGFAWRKYADLIIIGHDEKGNPQFRLL